MTELRCETCFERRAVRAYGERGSYFCRAHRPLPSAPDLVFAARSALDERRTDDLRRLLRLLAVAVRRSR